MTDVCVQPKHFTYTMVTMPEPGSTVAVGMSGGVDSTLTAILLKEAGCKVIGVTMSNWNHDLDLPHSVDGLRNSCYGPDEQLDIDACAIFCKSQGIEYHVIDVREAYHREVLEYFKSEYRAGRTPNPCIRCNRLVKFGAFLSGIRTAGIDYDYFCTGHYAQLVRPEFDLCQLYGEQSSITDGSINLRPLLISQASDPLKDQAYFLYRISSEVLEKVRFPLGGYLKKDVFKMAVERKLVAADRAESQDFVPPEFFDKIFSDRPPRSGDIVDRDGNVLGRHRGIEYYTVGQRRGLGVSASRPMYVYAVDAAKNQVVLADNDDLLTVGLYADDWVWPGNYAPRTAFNAMVKIRLASKPVEASVEPVAEMRNADGSPAEYRIMFSIPQRAVAPGQSAVVYLNGTIVGGGIISRAIYD